MWTYEKKLQFPVNIKQTNSRLAKVILTQYGGRECIRYDTD
jgi:spore coat protein JC